MLQPEESLCFLLRVSLETGAPPAFWKGEQTTEQIIVRSLTSLSLFRNPSLFRDSLLCFLSRAFFVLSKMQRKEGKIMKLIKTEEAAGHVLCHDLTQIIPGVTKDARFRKGHIVQEEDIPVLLSMGKENLYVWEKKEGILHEDEAAEILRDLCLSKGMHATSAKEGKIELISDVDGLFLVDAKRLMNVNLLGDMMIAARHTNSVVHPGDKLAGTRIIPLVIEEEKMKEAKNAAGSQPLLKIAPFKLKTAGIITTGSEVKKGLIQDQFTPVVKKKLKDFGIETVKHVLSGDDKDFIVQSIQDMEKEGVDLIVCTGGMSVDPDDRTPGAIKECGARIVTYGAPVLPGAMLCLGYLEQEKTVPVIGLPGCVMYAKATVFDLILPRIAAGIEIEKKELAALGHGGLCLGCPVCRYPECSFGKGGFA